MRKLVIISLVLLCGCALESIARDTVKQWQAEGRVNNPEVMVYYMTGVGVRVIGMDGTMQAEGTGPTTRPAKE